MDSVERILWADRALLRSVERAIKESARLSGQWLACRKGCTLCCIGPFPITQLDALRLRARLAELAVAEPDRAERIRRRAENSLERFRPHFPGDWPSGTLSEDEGAEERFATLTENEPCPALDPETGACELYEARPITCRTFGPAVRVAGENLGVCQLCYQGATDAEIAACEVDFDPDNLESLLLGELERSTGRTGRTLVAFALARGE